MRSVNYFNIFKTKNLQIFKQILMNNQIAKKD